MERHRPVLSIIGVAAALAIGAPAYAVVLSGRVAVVEQAGVPACTTLDVAATVRTRDADSKLRGERDLVARADALRSDGSRWSYQLEIPGFARPGETDEVMLAARCDTGRDPLLRPIVRTGGAWQNPFALPAAGDLKRSFRVRLMRASEPAREIVLGPSATDAFGSLGFSGSSPCDARPPSILPADAHATVAGTSNDPGNDCSMHTDITGVLRFDLSGVAPFSERLEGAELRYVEQEVAWRNPDGSSSAPEGCVGMLQPGSEPPYGWGMSRAVADDRTSWDVTDLVWWWSESTDDPTLYLLPEDIADDGAAACLSRLSGVELVIHLGD